MLIFFQFLFVIIIFAIIFDFSYIFYSDAPIPWQINFQDPATPIMEGIINVHHHVFFFLIIIFIFVSYMLVRTIQLFYINLEFRKQHEINVFNNFITSKFNFNNFLKKLLNVLFTNNVSKLRQELNYIYSINLNKNKYDLLTINTLSIKEVNSIKLSHNTLVEIIWTIGPAIILIFLALPTFDLIFGSELVEAWIGLTFKAIGSQWYWSYEITDKIKSMDTTDLIYVNKNFDSYMLPENDFTKEGQLRLLEVDNILYLPVGVHIRLLTTSNDVIHSWAVPSLGVKVDALPGRINQAYIFLKRGGIFFGQCSEICGVNHGFMPIVVKGVDINDFTMWVFTN